jgi:hypothetical protein
MTGHTDQSAKGTAMLTTLIVTTIVVAFALVAAIGHVLLFTAVVFGRGTIFADKGAKGRESANRPLSSTVLTQSGR